MTEPSGAHPIDRHDVAEAFRAIAELLEAVGENPFKARAYVNGARAIEQLPGELGDLIVSGELARTKGFGPALVEKATTYWKTGRLPYLEELKARFPPGLLDLQAVPGIGPKKALALNAALGIETLDELEAACREGRVREVAGFGAKTEARVLEGIAFARSNQQRRLRSAVEAPAGHLLDLVRRLPGIVQAELAGSLRRRRETIGDLDIVAAAEAADAAEALEAFTRLPPVATVVARGENRCSVRLGSRLQADLIVVQPAQFGAALLHFTGSKEFNQALRGRAKAKGLKLSEYGLFDVSDGGERLVRADDEAGVLAELGVPWIPPELREGPGDLELALQDAGGAPPRLVELADVRGVLHVHSTWSDGRDALEDMVLAAQERGFEYVGISDHSQTASYANGMTVERVLQQREELDRIQSRVRIRILKGIESDILGDGSLDYPPEILDGFDFVIASVHSQFRMPKDEMTRRLVAAVSQPRTRILGHPTGRLLLSREGYTFDLDAVLAACRAHGTAIEINAWPNRLDLDWRDARRLPEAGVLACLNPDAHRTTELDFVRYGVEMARKARLGPEHVLNTRPAEAILSKRPA
jgi:DNA polymerase (family X)